MIRDQAYPILSDLVYKGFLATGVRLAENFFVFKTINNKEHDLIKLSAGNSKDKGYKVRFNSYFLTYSLFMVDGRNVLMDRASKIEEYYKFFINIPEELYKVIYVQLNELRTSMFDATNYLEGFSYTDNSRYMWKIMKDFPNREEFTGIKGTRELGLNVHQESWTNINRIMDQEEEYNEKFNLAVLIASASNPKGAKQVRGQHETRVKGLQEKRDKLAKLGYMKQGGWKPEGWAASVDTAEDLVAELERQVHGIKDKHDVYMEKYMQGIREKAEKKTREAKERMEAAYKAGDGVMFSGEQRVLTPEEMAAMTKRKKSHMVKVASEEAVSIEDKENFLKKVGSKILTGRN